MLDKWEEYLNIKTDNDYISLYVHIPYCATKCNYCMHLSKQIHNTEQIDNYLDELEKQFISYSTVLKGEPIKSVYIGGGTPSILSMKQLERFFKLFGYFNIDKNIDNMFSFECNPNSLTIDKINFLHSTFINRISMGVQSIDKSVLKKENRNNPDNTLDLIHTLMDVFKDKKSRINIDLMYGLLGQSVISSLTDILTISDTRVSKITYYGNRKQRSNIEKQKFEDEHHLILDKFTNLDYNKFVDLNQYREVNYFINKNFNGWFKHIYTTQPLIYNNCLGLGFMANSWIIPSKTTYSTLSDKYDKNLHYDNYTSLCNGLEKKIDKLRKEQVNRNWSDLPMCKIIS